MPENPNQPREYDAVLGGQNPPTYAAVLGGIQGIKKRLSSPILEVRINALSDALNYGEKGLDLVLQALQNESIPIKIAAYSLLKNRQEAKVKQQLDNFLPFFEFEVVTVDIKGQINNRDRHYARCFTEDLGNDIKLDMVAIPGGTFFMGSLKTEKERQDWETPQHQVTVQPFFFGKYPVTQAQWQAVAALPKINLTLNPNPSCFRGENLPVENVSWDEAQEFCKRLWEKTGKIYRLPSEAEWEYACRAGTTTPFHFGETITSDLGNYIGVQIYREEPKGIDRKETTPVDNFPPNAFGLYDMHGNVWEWCADPWHSYYHDAPKDGSVWIYGGDNQYRQLRGGAWCYFPRCSRSAFRFKAAPSSRYPCMGFRVACSSPWTL